MKFILASSSPRRIEYLSKWGFLFESYKAEINEIVIEGKPIETALRNAIAKATSVAKLKESYTVVGIDTVVAINGKILGKPRNENENFNMIKLLSGKEHAVITGICVVKRNIFALDYVETFVKFRKLNKEEIMQYVKTHEGIDKAGGYAIQNLASDFVVEVKGILDNVIGIPTFNIKKLLSIIKDMNER